MYACICNLDIADRPPSRCLRTRGLCCAIMRVHAGRRNSGLHAQRSARRRAAGQLAGWEGLNCDQLANEPMRRLCFGAHKRSATCDCKQSASPPARRPPCRYARQPGSAESCILKRKGHGPGQQKDTAEIRTGKLMIDEPQDSQIAHHFVHSAIEALESQLQHNLYR